MSEPKGMPFGICVLPEPRQNVGRAVQYAGYITEVLDHAGLCYEAITPERLPASLASLDGFRILLTIGEAALSEELRQALQEWVAAGGVWISLGGVCGLETVLGVERAAPAYANWGAGIFSLGEGYLHPAASHPIVAPISLPLHFFGGIAVVATTATTLATVSSAHQQPTPYAGMTTHEFGEGVALLVAPDVTGTLAHIQQGIAITRDGVSAPDGTAPITDGVLKSDDGAVLDWIFDRQPVPNVPGYQAFLEPVADHWRELLLRTLFALAQRQGVVLPLLWLYPDNLPALAHLSHDTDGNTAEEAWGLLEALQEIEIHSTWCVILPGYSPEIMAAIQKAGHELAMHYDAMSDGTHWCQTEFDQQWAQLTALFGDLPPSSNKNHYLRWEGDTEFYHWCEAKGIELDQSKGASKTGEAGFNFGTCHLYFPVDPDGALLDVLALSTPTQDLGVFAPAALLEPLLDAVFRHHGVLHLLFHPAHIFKPDVAAAIRAAADHITAHGMAFWTAERLNRWERARRHIDWSRFNSSESATEIELQTGEALPGATLLWLSAVPGIITIDGEARESQTVERWGFEFQSITFDAEPGAKYTLRFAAEPRSSRENQP